MSVINTNITSQIGQQNLSKSQNALSTAMERLSSGSRINSAKDDAAGQAIANRMTAQITGLAQAQRNANDGVSVAQTAEGALGQVNDNLQRIRELSVQAANGTNSSTDLQSIQDEIGARLEEIDRISEQTDFNGKKILGAGTADINIQVGANDGETITIKLSEISAETLGLGEFTVAGDRAATASDVLVGAAEDDTVEIDGVTYTRDDQGVWTGDDEVTADPTGTPPVVGVAASTIASDSAVATRLAAEGGEATIGANTYSVNDTGAVTNDADEAVFVDASAEELTFVTGDDATAATVNPLAAIDKALQDVDTMRSDLGASMNRFETAIENLSTNQTNLDSARSRIEDADYAVEVSNMTRAQILQQAGTSVLAQANQVPQGVLSLLG